MSFSQYTEFFFLWLNQYLYFLHIQKSSLIYCLPTIWKQLVSWTHTKMKRMIKLQPILMTAYSTCLFLLSDKQFHIYIYIYLSGHVHTLVLDWMVFFLLVNQFYTIGNNVFKILPFERFSFWITVSQILYVENNVFL